MTRIKVGKADASPSPAQLRAIEATKAHGSFRRPYMPYADVAHSYMACERKGWLTYYERDLSKGHESNGYIVTDAGHRFIK